MTVRVSGCRLKRVTETGPGQLQFPEALAMQDIQDGRNGRGGGKLEAIP